MLLTKLSSSPPFPFFFGHVLSSCKQPEKKMRNEANFQHNKFFFEFSHKIKIVIWNTADRLLVPEVQKMTLKKKLCIALENKPAIGYLRLPLLQACSGRRNGRDPLSLTPYRNAVCCSYHLRTNENLGLDKLCWLCKLAPLAQLRWLKLTWLECRSSGLAIEEEKTTIKAVWGRCVELRWPRAGRQIWWPEPVPCKPSTKPRGVIFPHH